MTETESKPPPPLVFLDTETTSLDRETRWPWEIALIRREPDGHETTWSAFVAVEMDKADAQSLRIGRYFERHPDAVVALDDRRDLLHHERQGGRLVSIYEAALRVELLTRGAVLVGAVPSFDEEMLNRMLRKSGLCPSWSHRLVCVETMAAAVLGWPVPRGLGKSAVALGIEVDSAVEHTALGDAVLAKRVYDAVLAEPEPIDPADLVDAERPTEAAAETSVA